MEMDDLCFFDSIWRFSDSYAGSAGFLVLRYTKRYFGDACMKQEWAGKTLYLGLLSYLMRLGLGLEICKTFTWPLAYRLAMDTKL